MAIVKFYSYLKSLVGSLKTNPKRFWAFLKCIKGKHSEMPPIVDHGRRIVDDREKADALNRMLSSKFSDPAVAVLPSVPNHALDPLRSFYVSEELVRGIRCSINQHKECVPDNVCARIISECAVELRAL